MFIFTNLFNDSRRSSFTMILWLHFHFSSTAIVFSHSFLTLFFAVSFSGLLLCSPYLRLHWNLLYSVIWYVWAYHNSILCTALLYFALLCSLKVRCLVAFFNGFFMFTSSSSPSISQQLFHQLFLFSYIIVSFYLTLLSKHSIVEMVENFPRHFPNVSFFSRLFCDPRPINNLSL